MITNILISSLLIGILSHVTVQKVFVKLKRFDDFNFRTSHKTLATRTGGIGVFMTLFFISFYYYFKQIEIFDYSLLIPIGIMFFVGVYDDLYNADFKLKFFLQIIVAKILIDQGYFISDFYGLFGINEIPWFVSQLLTILAFLTIVNAINFIDGIDGLAITEVIKVLLFIELFSKDFTSLSILNFICIASIVSLYYFNFKKKLKIFLGDSGSLLLGTLLAINVFFIIGANFNYEIKSDIDKIYFLVLLLFYPLFDLIRVFILRIYNKKSPFQPDQNHFHHLLLKKKYSHIHIVFLIKLIFTTPLIIYIFFK